MRVSLWHSECGCSLVLAAAGLLQARASLAGSRCQSLGGIDRYQQAARLKEGGYLLIPGSHLG